MSASSHHGGQSPLIPFEQKRGADVVGQVCNDARAVARDTSFIDIQRITLDDFQLPAKVLLQLDERRDASTGVALDRDNGCAGVRARPGSIRQDPGRLRTRSWFSSEPGG